MFISPNDGPGTTAGDIIISKAGYIGALAELIT